MQATALASDREYDEAAQTNPVVVRDLRKTYKTQHGEVHAIDSVSLEVERSQILVLLGPSGCGKTTLLRSIAGITAPDSGDISISGRRVFSGASRLSLPPEKRGVGFVFQSYALWPHMTVVKNVMFPLLSAGVRKPEARERALEVLSVVGCGDLASRYPSELSGGQQQRVSLARAIARHHGVVLFDEPLSNIDAKVRERIRLELLNIRQLLGFAAIYVTHDQEEAMILGDRIAVMDRGHVQQIGTAREIYARPNTRWVADFVGTANFLDGEVAGIEQKTLVVTSVVGPLRVARRDGDAVRIGQKGTVFFRPGGARVESSQPAGPNAFPCTVRRTIYIGDRVDVVVEVGGIDVIAQGSGTGLPTGASAWLSLSSDALAFLQA